MRNVAHSFAKRAGALVFAALTVAAGVSTADRGTGKGDAKEKEGKGRHRVADHLTLVSVFTPSPVVLDFPYQQAVIAFERNVEAATDIEVDVIWANEVPTFYPGGNAEVFAKLKEGVDVQVTHGLPRLLVHGDARDQFKDIFENLPFGPNKEEFQAWIRFGGGQALYDEFYAPDGLLPFIGGNSGAQMGGWFADPIDDASQFAGLRIRIAGFASEVLNYLGATAFSTPVGQVNMLIQNGSLDAAELCCPITDTNFGVAQTAQGLGWIYHYPGWHEPHANAQFLFNAEVFHAFPPKKREILKRAMLDAAREADLIFDEKNRGAWQAMMAMGVQTHRFPDALIDELRAITESVVYTRLRAIPDFNYLSGRILDSMVTYTDQIGDFGKLSEGGYYETRSLP